MVSLFGAFLHGCGLHSRFDLGELAIKRMLELHPGEDLLICANCAICMLRMQDGAKLKQVRELIKNLRGLMKIPGCSLMEMAVDHDYSFSMSCFSCIVHAFDGP
ncbi:hypothetical protein NC652_027064 [Populus alba x Populus x berolinensis]|nr:hypothetical protein NC652_027064 [Populus alba x Populus x berolinensis]